MPLLRLFVVKDNTLVCVYALIYINYFMTLVVSFLKVFGNELSTLAERHYQTEITERSASRLAPGSSS